MLFERGQPDIVRERAKIALAAAEGTSRTLDVGLALRAMARVHFARGELVAAIAAIEQAVHKVRGSGARRHLVSVLLSRAELRLANHDLPLCGVDLDEALTLSTSCGFRLYAADAHLGLARLALAEHDAAAAAGHLAKARAIITDTGYHRRDQELAELVECAVKEEAEIKRRDAGSQGRGKAEEEKEDVMPSVDEQIRELQRSCPPA
jgi:hypothetical protein